jgi:hypothetical protein
MAKPSQRQSTHVQPGKDNPVDNPPALAAPESPEVAPVVRRENARGRLWLALLLWAFVFGLLFIWLLIDLVVSLFLR